MRKLRLKSSDLVEIIELASWVMPSPEAMFSWQLPSPLLVLQTYLSVNVVQHLSEFLLLLFGCSVVSDSLRPHGLYPARLLCPWDLPRLEYWTGILKLRLLRSFWFSFVLVCCLLSSNTCLMWTISEKFWCQDYTFISKSSSC